MSKTRSILLGLVIAMPLAHAGTITLNFEGFADSTTLTNQYGGFIFANTEIMTAGLSLNELEFPPESGSNVAGNAGGPVTIAFTTPVLSMSAFFTYAGALTVDAFDSLNQSVGTTNSAFASNVVSSGNPPDELLQVSFSGGISSVRIEGDPSGSPFVLDDLTISTPDAATPEPSTLLLIVGALALVGPVRARLVPIPVQ